MAIQGRILVRESGTEPVLRVMVEAETKEICQKYVSRVVDVDERKGICSRISTMGRYICLKNKSQKMRRIVICVE